MKFSRSANKYSHAILLPVNGWEITHSRANFTHAVRETVDERCNFFRVSRRRVASRAIFRRGPIGTFSWRRSKRCRLFTSTNKNRVSTHDGETGKNIIRLCADGRINPNSSSNDELRNPRVMEGTQTFSEIAFFDAGRASRIILTHRGIGRGRSFR